MCDLKLSIIIPCYNEGEKLISNIIKINKYMENNLSFATYEIIVVNDGSTDNTAEIILNNKEKFQNTRLISYAPNKGKGGAVKCGVEDANGEWILFMDADLSTYLSAIRTTFENMDYSNIIIGSRRHKESNIIKKQGFVRNIVGKCCVILTNLITHVDLSDTQCGFKAMKTSLAKKIVAKQTINTWAFDVEWLFIAKLNNEKIKEIPVTWENDSDSKVSTIKSSIKFFIDLLKIVKNKKSYRF